METEKLEFNLQAELKSVFEASKDDEAKEALLALESIDQTLQVIFAS